MPLRRKRIKFFDAFLQGAYECRECNDQDRFALTILMSQKEETQNAVEAWLENKMKDSNEFEGFGSDLAMIDLDNLERFLAIVVKYLPMILEIVLPLFMSE